MTKHSIHIDFITITCHLYLPHHETLTAVMVDYDPIVFLLIL